MWGTGIRGLMRGMAALPQGNQELLVVRDKVGTPPGELGVSKSNRAMLQSNCHHQQTNTQLFTDRMLFLSPNRQCQIKAIYRYKILTGLAVCR